METLFENLTTTIARDLKLNLTKLLDGGALAPDEAHLALLAAATNLEQTELAAAAADRLAKLGVPNDHIQEARQSAALVGMLNTYYRFRHFVGSQEEYRAAGLRMTVLAKPLLGKERFEMLAFAVSVLNGCESCVRAHEKTLRDGGISSEKVHDLAKLASVLKALRTLTQLVNSSKH